MYQVLAEELLKNIWIAEVEVDHNKSGFVGVEMPFEKGLDSFSTLSSVKLFSYNSPRSVHQSEPIPLVPTILRKLLIIVDDLDFFHQLYDCAVHRAVERNPNCPPE